jgi:phage terminase large subunit-like protein
VRGHWNEEYLDEAEVFPYGEHDDQVDSVSGAVEVLNQAPLGEVDEDLAYADDPFDPVTEGFS